MLVMALLVVIHAAVQWPALDHGAIMA